MSGTGHNSARPITDPAFDWEAERTLQQNEIGQLWDEYAPGMLRFAVACTGSRELSEEAVQEAFAAILGRIRDDRPAGSGKEFLYSALCEAIQLRRREANPPPADPEAPVCSRPDFDAPLRAAEVRRRLNRIASPRELEMLQLRASGFSYAEIARVLMITPGTVASTLARAFKKVRSAFEEVRP